MDGAATFYGRINEGGGYSVLARVVSLDGSGTSVSSSEGYCLKRSDVSTITCRVFDLGDDRDEPAGTEITPAPTLAPSTNLYDALVTNGWPVTEDPYGYNFRHDVGPAYAPAGGTWVLLEYKFTLTTGGVVWFREKVKTVAIRSLP